MSCPQDLQTVIPRARPGARNGTQVASGFADEHVPETADSCWETWHACCNAGQDDQREGGQKTRKTNQRGYRFGLLRYLHRAQFRGSGILRLAVTSSLYRRTAMAGIRRGALSAPAALASKAAGLRRPVRQSPRLMDICLDF